MLETLWKREMIFIPFEKFIEKHSQVLNFSKTLKRSFSYDDIIFICIFDSAPIFTIHSKKKEES